MQVKLENIENIKKNKDNPRTIKDEKFNKLVKSIKALPQMLKLRPIVVNDDMVVLGGNMRLEACKKAGLEEVPIIKASELNEEQQKEFIIKDNSSFGEWDWDILKEDWDLQQIADWGVDIPDVEILELEPEETVGDDDIPEIQEEPITKMGDLYELGDHRLICGDATLIKTYESLMGDNYADLVITDPPYNVDYEGGTKDKLKIKNDKMDDNKFYNFLFDSFKNIHNVTKKGGAIYIWHADSEGYNFRKAFIKSGFLLKQCLIWVKNTLVLGRQDYQWKHEPCLYGWKDGSAHFFINNRTKTTVLEQDKLDISKMNKDEMKKLLQDIFSENSKSTILNANKPSRSSLHPTMKPVELFLGIIENSSIVNQIVLDPFLGSGTTLIASEKSMRKLFGIELDPHYCDVIVRRYINFCKENNRLYSVKRNGEVCEDFNND